MKASQISCLRQWWHWPKINVVEMYKMSHNLRQFKYLYALLF
jgi:hypothetical protein